MAVPEDQVAEFFTKGTTWMNLGLLASCSLKIYQQKLTVESWFSIIFLTCFGMSFLLSAIGIYTSGSNQRTTLIWRCNMAYWTTILRIAAAAALLMFLDINHAVIAGPIFTLVLLILRKVHPKTIPAPPPDDRLDYTYWPTARFEKLKLQLDISREVVSISFACLCGTLLGYMKGTWTLTHGYKAPECYVFYSFVLALIVVLLSTMPHTVIPDARGPIANTYMPILTYASLLFLVLASIMAAQEIVREYVFLALLPVITTFMRCLLSEYNRRNSTPHRYTFSENTTFWTLVFVPYITFLFLALMAAHSKYGIGTGNTASLSWWFKGFVISALCSIPIYASRTVIFAETKWTQNNPALPTEPWDWAAFVTAVITVVCFVIALRHQLDDFTNIF
jgi:hypothetical protein